MTNQQALAKFKDDELNRHNLEFGLFVAKIDLEKKSAKLATPRSVINAPDTNNVLSTKQENPSKPITQDQAISKLKRKLNTKSETRNVKLKVAPRGRSQFMLGECQGKTRPVKVLFDTGCSGALFGEGVPQTELSPSVLMTEVPFVVNAVGDSQVKVNDLWMTSVALRDGCRQPLEGWAVDKVTSTFPFVNMIAAEAKIKSDAPNDKKLQELKSPPNVGGDVDILLGIAYTSIFPERVHMMESGLAIYELKMSPHTKGYNAVIGGPSEHFEALVGSIGSMGLVFANLTKQLEN